MLNLATNDHVFTALNNARLTQARRQKVSILVDIGDRTEGSRIPHEFDCILGIILEKKRLANRDVENMP